MIKFEDIPDDAVDIFRAHVKLYLEEPEKAHLWNLSQVGEPGLVPTLLLTTKGRKSGKIRHAPLVYIDNGGSYFILGSKGGLDSHPSWYLNLLDQPECEIRVSTLHTKARARVLEGEEREAAWEKITAQRPFYVKYQGRTERQIPVILLEPIAN